jgi:hypothetical protein
LFKKRALYDSEDYLKNLSSANLNNSPKPKAVTSKITSQIFVSKNDLEDLKKELEQSMNTKMDTIIQLLHNQTTTNKKMNLRKMQKKKQKKATTLENNCV